jgi:hypothetical protein
MRVVVTMIFFIGTIAAISVNAVVMIISPRLWFQMPQWIRLSGGLARENYASGFGAVQVRVLGALFLGLMVYFIYAFLSGHP